MSKSNSPSARPPRTSGAVTRIDQACRRAVLGKLAMRDIADWVGGAGLSEAEFRLLWLLFPAADHAALQGEPALDQTALAAALAVSPAQVSAVVDRLRAAGRITVTPPGGRRRQLWRLTPTGRELVLSVVAAVDALPPAGSAGKEAA